MKEEPYFMPFATWWRGDSLPTLSPLPTFSVHSSTDTQLIARLANLPEQEVRKRIREENRPYIAFIDETPTAYGWVATRKSGIDVFQFSFTIPPKNLYLWDFLTLPQWRGRGIYPHLLQAIIQQEQAAERFWIGYEPTNETSAHSIKKAGFQVVCDIVIARNRVIGLTLFDANDHAQASADFFQLPVIAETKTD